jgi:hypothetical protein
MDDDSVAMLRTARERLQDQQVERALQHVRIGLLMSPRCLWKYVSSRRPCQAGGEKCCGLNRRPIKVPEAK